MTKLNKSAYEKLIKEDIQWLDRITPEEEKSPCEYGHIKMIVEQSVDHYYPDQSIEQQFKEIERLRDEKDQALHFIMRPRVTSRKKTNY